MTAWVIWHQKGKPFNGIRWTICKSFAPRCRQITTPVPHHSVLSRWRPSCRPSNSVKALKATWALYKYKYFYGRLAKTLTKQNADASRGQYPCESHFLSAIIIFLLAYECHPSSDGSWCRESAKRATVPRWCRWLEFTWVLWHCRRQEGHLGYKNLQGRQTDTHLTACFTRTTWVSRHQKG